MLCACSTDRLQCSANCFQHCFVKRQQVTSLTGGTRSPLVWESSEHFQHCAAFPQVLGIKESIIKYVMEPNKKAGIKAPIKREIK